MCQGQDQGQEPTLMNVGPAWTDVVLYITTYLPPTPHPTPNTDGHYGVEGGGRWGEWARAEEGTAGHAGAQAMGATRGAHALHVVLWGWQYGAVRAPAKHLLRNKHDRPEHRLLEVPLALRNNHKGGCAQGMCQWAASSARLSLATMGRGRGTCAGPTPTQTTVLQFAPGRSGGTGSGWTCPSCPAPRAGRWC